MDRTAKKLRFALTRDRLLLHREPRHRAREDRRDVRPSPKRFHDQPVPKLELKLDQHNTGYLPMRGNTRTSTVQTGTKANLNEAFFVKREMAPDHPDVYCQVAASRGLNRWPDLPGFRDTVVDATATRWSGSFRR